MCYVLHKVCGNNLTNQVETVIALLLEVKFEKHNRDQMKERIYAILKISGLTNSCKVSTQFCLS